MTRLARIAVCVLAVATIAAAQAPRNLTELFQQFQNPPDDARIMMRWWWFGPSVEKAELEREMRLMKEAGIGGFEVQPVYPVMLDDPERGFRNYPYMSDEFLDALKFTSQKAKELGLRMDLTLGSGWPFGGPHIRVTEAAGRLRCDRVVVAAGAKSVAMPDVGVGEKFIAAFLAKGDARTFAPDGIRRMAEIERGRLKLPSDLGPGHVVLFFVASRSGMQVKRPGIGAEGYVLDHYDRGAIERHLKVQGDRLMSAFGANKPYAVFSDSLEVYNSDWTGDFLEQFQKRRGYDLTPFLPALAGDIGEKTGDVRRDWGRTLTELVDERYLMPLREWAAKNGTKFRSQTYGTPPVVLSSNNLVDLPEGEGFHWRQFSSTRWASSASHLYDRPVTSSETWTWLHSPSFRATPLDMKAEADLHFLQGVNQLIGHGWPYSPALAGEPGWRFYAAAVFNEHNPWWIVMPDITKYLQRVSWLLRQGKPVIDVALYLPTEDAWESFGLGRTAVNQAMERLLPESLIPQILDAGYNFDFIDDRAIEQLGVAYPVLVIPPLKRMPAATTAKIEEYRRKGGKVLDLRGRAVED
ncbi:MAG TPA: glycosyl hydrolase, partial [Bryobacteraceae bacterium]|nr:glycosyl hydrolase [Bryobacteraceae bacterium]